uniref:Uncharacterized protein n=1 Tax=Acrobeloides nanus TaxID=290746 RepID=A0A914E4P5_9BILA
MKYYNQPHVKLTSNILHSGENGAPPPYFYQNQESPNLTVPVIGEVSGPSQTVIPVVPREGGRIKFYTPEAYEEKKANDIICKLNFVVILNIMPQKNIMRI